MLQPRFAKGRLRLLDPGYQQFKDKFLFVAVEQFGDGI